MSEGILSQAEIDALLKENDYPQEEEKEEGLPKIDFDALGEIANISMGTAATTLSSLLGKKVEITTPRVELTTLDELRALYPRPFVVINVKYTEGLKGNNVLVISTRDAAVIADLMMGGNGTNPVDDMTEIQISAVSEAMNQMMGSASTSMSTFLDKRIDISPPLLDLVDFQENGIMIDENLSDKFIKVSFNMVIQGLVNSELMQLMPLEFADEIIKELFAFYQNESSVGTNEDESIITEPPREKYPEMSEGNNINNNKGHLEKESIPNENNYTVQPLNFTQLKTPSEQGKPQNLDLILDVPLQISVELGRTNRTIKEILEFSTGSIIELNKLAGEPIDMMVNGKLFAKGEVVVIDENFGVRITDIVSPLERVKNLQ